MSLGVRLEQGLGDEFGVDFDEFDEFGGHFLVCLRETGARLISLRVRLMSLGVGLQQELRGELRGGLVGHGAPAPSPDGAL